MSPQAGYLLVNEVIPRLISAVPNAVPITFPDDPQEIIADGTAMAAQMIDGAEKNGKRIVKSPTKANGKYRKQPKEVTCGNISYYVIQKLRCGRRSTGSSVSDVCGVGTQIQGNARLSSFDEEVTDDDLGEPLLLHDVLAANQDDPATKACRHLDWSEFMAGLSERDPAIIECMVAGKPLASLARKKGFNTSTLRYHKERLAKAILEFMGLHILSDIQRRPGWKDSLNATHERLACRDQRRSL